MDRISDIEPDHKLEPAMRKSCRVPPKAYCTNYGCVKNQKGSERTMSPSETFCIFCGHAVFWTNNIHKSTAYSTERYAGHYEQVQG